MLGVIAVLAGGVREELQRAFLLRRFEQHLGGPIVGVHRAEHRVRAWDITRKGGMR